MRMCLVTEPPGTRRSRRSWSISGNTEQCGGDGSDEEEGVDSLMSKKRKRKKKIATNVDVATRPSQTHRGLARPPRRPWSAMTVAWLSWSRRRSRRAPGMTGAVDAASWSLPDARAASSRPALQFVANINIFWGNGCATMYISYQLLIHIRLGARTAARHCAALRMDVMMRRVAASSNL